MTAALAEPVVVQNALHSQVIWDLHLKKTFERLKDVLNPDLRQDLALDATIRCLGPRPRPPLPDLEARYADLQDGGALPHHQSKRDGQDEWRNTHIAFRWAGEELLEELCEMNEGSLGCG